MGLKLTEYEVVRAAALEWNEAEKAVDAGRDALLGGDRKAWFWR